LELTRLFKNKSWIG